MERFVVSDCINGQPVRSNYQGITMPQTLEYAKETGMIGGYEECAGMYEGQAERSFIITGASEDIIIKLLLGYNQNCALSLNKNRGMGLVRVGQDDKLAYEHLGQYKTGDSLPSDVKNYTFSPLTGRYLWKY